MGIFASKAAAPDGNLEQEAVKANKGYPPAYSEQDASQAEFRYKDRTKPKDTGPKTLESRYNKWESTMMGGTASSGGVTSGFA